MQQIEKLRDEVTTNSICQLEDILQLDQGQREQVFESLGMNTIVRQIMQERVAALEQELHCRYCQE